MINEIKYIINTHTYEVDEWLLNKFEWYRNNTNIKRTDALALELTLAHTGKIAQLPKLQNETYQWRHDWAFSNDVLIDLKRRPQKDKHGNVCKNISFSPKLMTKSYNMVPRQLTHVVAYSQNIETNYKIGDKLKFVFEGIEKYDVVYKNSLKMSDDYNLLNVKSCLQTEPIVV